MTTPYYVDTKYWTRCADCFRRLPYTPTIVATSYNSVCHECWGRLVSRKKDVEKKGPDV